MSSYLTNRHVVNCIFAEPCSLVKMFQLAASFDCIVLFFDYKYHWTFASNLAVKRDDETNYKSFSFE